MSDDPQLRHSLSDSSEAIPGTSDTSGRRRERRELRTFAGCRQALLLPRPPAGSPFIEYPHASVKVFKCRVHPTGRRQYVFRMQADVLEPDGSTRSKDVRETLGDVAPSERALRPGEVTYDAALAAAANRRQLLLAAQAPNGKRRLTVAEARALQAADVLNKRPPTLDKEQQIFDRYLAKYSDRFLDELDTSEVVAFSNSLLAGKYAPGKAPLAIETVRGILTCLSNLFEIAHTHEGIQGRSSGWNPASLAKRRLPSQLSQARSSLLSLTDLRRAWLAADIACSSWARDQFRIYVLTGLRHGLVASLRFSEIDFERRCLLISPHKPGTKRRAASTKDKEEAIRLPMPQLVLDILRSRQQLAPDPAGLVWYLEAPVSGRGASTAIAHRDPRTNFARLAQLAGVVAFTPHDLRRTFATLGLASGADVIGTSLLMLHSSSTLAKATGVAAITIQYMHTPEAQRRMRTASLTIEAEAQRLLAGGTVADIEDLPPELEAAVGGNDIGKAG